MVQVLDRKFEVAVHASEIQARIKEMAASIKADLGDKKPLLIAVLNGAFIFAADLIRSLDFPCEICFVKYKSYVGMQSTGNVTGLIGLEQDIKGRHVIIVEDIVDSGLTMQSLQSVLLEKEPASLRIACCAMKPAALKCPLKVDYVAFDFENLFLVGYGLDYDGYGRNLPDIYVLSE